MKISKFLIPVVLLLSGSWTASSAQEDLGKQLSKVAGTNAVSYLTPFLSGLGADLNSGFYHSADLHEILGFDIGVKVGATLMRDEDKVFDFILPDEINYSFGVQDNLKLRAGTDYDKVVPNTPTAVGDKTGKPVRVKPTSAYAAVLGNTPIFTTPQGFDLTAVPLVVPQVAIGLPMGLEVVGRFIPTISLGDAGKVNFLGFGLRHDIDQYIPLFPVDVAIHFMTQKLTFSDQNDKKLLTGDGTAYGIEISKKLALFTLYGGYQIEKSSWDIESYEYTASSSGSPVKVPGFSVEGRNTSRFHAGLRILLLFLNVHADYSFATQPVATVGVGITFR